jgi:hypothetical protein
MKNSNDIIRNRTRDLLACNAVPQPTAPPRAPRFFMDTDINRHSAPISTDNNSVKSKHQRTDNISLSIFHQNIRGLRSKLDELECHLLSNLPVLLCLTEHHLTEMEIQSLNTENYQLGSYYCRKHFISLFILLIKIH